MGMINNQNAARCSVSGVELSHFRRTLGAFFFDFPGPVVGS